MASDRLGCMVKRTARASNLKNKGNTLNRGSQAYHGAPDSESKNKVQRHWRKNLTKKDRVGPGKGESIPRFEVSSENPANKSIRHTI